MKRRILILMLSAGLAQAHTATQAESFTVNGLKIIFVPNTATDIVAAHMYFRGGSASLDASQSGLERLSLTVATRASKGYPKDKLSAAIARMGTQLLADAERDYAGLTLQCVRQNFQESWRILADVLLNPLFDSIDVELERERTLSGIRQAKDTPDRYLSELAIEAHYVGHPYSIDPMGTVETVKSFTPADLRSFMKRKLTAAGMLLVVVGNTTRSDLERLVKESFVTLPAGTPAGGMPPPVKHQTPSLKIVHRQLPTNYITAYFSAPAFGSDESAAMNVAGAILRDRFFEEVRTKRGLSYATGAGTGPLFSNYGMIYVTAVQPESTVSVMMRELKDMQDEPVPEKRVVNQRNTLLTRYLLNTETNQAQAELLARYELAGKGYQQAAKYMENVGKVTPADIQKVCREYMHNLQFVLLGNPESLRVAPFMY
jgi:predicted Zn-dependent peptidase